MIQDVLILLSKGNKTVNDLARTLSITPEQLRGHLDMLVHLGYLDKIETCKINKNKNEDKSNGKDQIDETMESYECKFCLFSKTCEPSKAQKKTVFIGYSLTSKGKKFLEQVTKK